MNAADAIRELMAVWQKIEAYVAATMPNASQEERHAAACAIMNRETGGNK